MQDYTPASLTNWGHKQASADPQLAGGGVIYKLLMRACPDFYVENAVCAMFPFTIPSETGRIPQTLGEEQDYGFSPPSLVGHPISVASWAGIFKVPWGPCIQYLMAGHD